MPVVPRGDYLARQPGLEAAAHEIVRLCGPGLVLVFVPGPAIEQHVEHFLVVAAERRKTAAAADSSFLDSE